MWKKRKEQENMSGYFTQPHWNHSTWNGEQPNKGLSLSTSSATLILNSGMGFGFKDCLFKDTIHIQVGWILRRKKETETYVSSTDETMTLGYLRYDDIMSDFQGFLQCYTSFQVLLTRIEPLLMALGMFFACFLHHMKNP